MGISRQQLIAFWQGLGASVESGTPVVEALRQVGEQVAQVELVHVTSAIRQALLDGKSIEAALRDFPEFFPDSVCVMIGRGEATGDLARQALRVAGIIEAEAGPVDSLPAVGQFLSEVLLNAVQRQASDIHADPTEDGRGRVRLRVDGVLHDIEQPPEKMYAEFVKRIKTMAAMDAAEKQLPQDGRITLNIGGKPVDLRVSAVPTVHGERVVMRVLFREALRLNLESIELLEDDLAKVRNLCHIPHGTILCAGPTGSGKTTLFYAMLNEIDRDRCCVISVEDPVEYHIEGVAQISVHPQIGRTFARTVRHVLRQDPDVILIGEIRDLEVANLVAQCALTGHVVLTTLHAATAPGGIKRLVDMGLEPFVANASIAGVISQRLVRMLCPDCRQQVEPPLHSVPPEAVELIKSSEPKAFYGPKGCDACHGMGYRGRTAIHEILIPDDRVKQAVASGGDLNGIREAALASGMRTLLGCGIEKAARGVTSIQEVLRVVPCGPTE